MATDRALFIGRFQPFHHGHQKVVERLLELYDEVIIAIGSAESSFTEDNPFSAGERVDMVRAAFTPSQLSRLVIIPVRDVNDHSLWVSHLKSYVPSFRVVHSNNPLVTELFDRAGVKVVPIEYVDRGLKEGKLIRELMAEGKDEWKRHVPEGCADFIESIKGAERLREMKRKR